MIFLITELICIAFQLLMFLPFYFAWRNDCEEFGKENLSVPLRERFFAWALSCPVWILPITCLLDRGE